MGVSYHKTKDDLFVKGRGLITGGLRMAVHLNDVSEAADVIIKGKGSERSKLNKDSKRILEAIVRGKGFKMITRE